MIHPAIASRTYLRLDFRGCRRSSTVHRLIREHTVVLLPAADDLQISIEFDASRTGVYLLSDDLHNVSLLQLSLALQSVLGWFLQLLLQRHDSTDKTWSVHW